ncbi:hypothetical protein EFR01_44350 [Sinorhizobium fredii]|nr:hypothetical protein EFR01_44350 [Sinorhizobium fredii]GLS10497.1 hypothetical protein GCM10007864_41280 [Sinorhizobium fredii]
MIRRDVDRDDWVEQGGITAGFRERRAHAGNVDERWAAGGVVHEDAIGQKRDLALARAGFEPSQNRLFRPRGIITGGSTFSSSTR